MPPPQNIYAPIAVSEYEAWAAFNQEDQTVHRDLEVRDD